MVDHEMFLQREMPHCLTKELISTFGSRATTAAAVRSQHGSDESYHPNLPPEMVVFAHSTQEVATIVRLCSQHCTPVIAFGAGTALEGHVNAVRGGVCIDLSQMNRILRVNASDLDCTVEAGVRRKQLNSHLRDSGLFFPIDPGPDATIGGMAATRASGTNAVRYGTMRENVLSLTVVLADGRVIKTAGRARKSSAGYDLTRIFVGSEGTLGIITEVTLRLHGIPEHVIVGRCTFPHTKSAIDTAITAIQIDMPLARVEFLDTAQIAAINAFSKLSLPEAPTLFFEFHGRMQDVLQQMELLRDIAEGNQGYDFQQADNHTDRASLWQARHDAYYAAVARRPGARGWATDVCVPISRLTECITETQKDLLSCSVPACIVGHVGDGNFHVVFSVDPTNKLEIDEITGISHRLTLRALGMDGTCTGEHGVGLGKRAYLLHEHGQALDVMRLLKVALDPNNILNPCKVIDVELAAEQPMGRAHNLAAVSSIQPCKAE